MALDVSSALLPSDWDKLFTQTHSSQIQESGPSSPTHRAGAGSALTAPLWTACYIQLWQQGRKQGINHDDNRSRKSPHFM
jgi:hypothetical protein